MHKLMAVAFNPSSATMPDALLNTIFDLGFMSQRDVNRVIRISHLPLLLKINSHCVFYYNSIVIKILFVNEIRYTKSTWALFKKVINSIRLW